MANQQELRCVEATAKVDFDHNGTFEPDEEHTVVQGLPPHTVVPPRILHRFTQEPPADLATPVCPGPEATVPQDVLAIRCVEFTIQVDTNLDGDYDDPGETLQQGLAAPDVRFTDGPLSAARTCTGNSIAWVAAPQALLRATCVEVRAGLALVASEIPPAEYQFYSGLPDHDAILGARCTGTPIDLPTNGDLEPVAAMQCLQVWINVTVAGQAPVVAALRLNQFEQWATDPPVPDPGPPAPAPAGPLVGMLAAFALAAALLRARRR